MTRHRYPTTALAGDYLRATSGLALVGAPLALVPLNPVVAALFAGLALLFASFGVTTALRQLRPIQVGEEAIAAGGPFPVRLEWHALDGIKLRYYATRRDGASGWMQLVLRAAGRQLKLDSRIEGFQTIAGRAAAAARARRIAIAPATAANFAAIGIPLAAEGG